MYLEQSLLSMILQSQAVLKIVGASVYPDNAPENAPATHIIYHQISGPREYTLDGKSDLASAHYQLSCFSDTYASARQLADAIRNFINGNEDADSLEVVLKNAQFQSITLEDESDIPTISAETQAFTRYGKRLDLEIWFNE